MKPEKRLQRTVYQCAFCGVANRSWRDTRRHPESERGLTMKATFCYDPQTKTLIGQAGQMRWKAAVADEIYLLDGKPHSMTEEALLALDGTTGYVKFPDSFAEKGGESRHDDNTG